MAEQKEGGAWREGVTDDSDIIEHHYIASGRWSLYSGSFLSSLIHSFIHLFNPSFIHSIIN